MIQHDEKVLINLKKAKSHISKIIKMVEDDDYCIDVVQQMNAVLGYLNSARSKKLESHMRTCFVDGTKQKSTKKRTELVDEVLRVMKISGN